MGSVTCHLSRPSSSLAESSPDLLRFEVEFVFERLFKLIAYGGIGEPDDVARAAVWLAADESDYITVTSLFIDGGLTLYLGFEANG
jgi:glucose 1-dehydrogenase